MRYFVRQTGWGSGFGGQPPTPAVIKKLLWANFIAWFVFSAAFAAGIGPLIAIYRWLSLTPASFVSGALWQPFTYMFLHAPVGVWHIGLNLLALWIFGGTLAREWGNRRFLHFYFICGAGAGLVDVAIRLWTGSGGAFTVGASGAVLAVVTAFAVTYPNAPILIFFVLPVPAWILAVAFAAINLLGALQDLARGGNPTATAFTVHLAGMALGYYFVRRRAGLPSFPRWNLERSLREWQLRRARRKFEVYMKNRGDGPSGRVH